MLAIHFAIARECDYRKKIVARLNLRAILGERADHGGALCREKRLKV